MPEEVSSVVHIALPSLCSLQGIFTTIPRSRPSRLSSLSPASPLAYSHSPPEVDLVLPLCSPLTFKPSSLKTAYYTPTEKEPSSFVPRHEHFLPSTGTHDVADHGVSFVAPTSRSSLVHCVLVPSRVGIYLLSDSSRRPRSTARSPHILAFITWAVKEFRPDSAVDSAVLCSECTGAPCDPFVCTARDRGTRVRSHFLVNAGRPSISCYLCRLSVLYEGLY